MTGLRRTKIVATIGPACDEPGVLGRVLSAGVDVARLNSSHGDIADLARRLSAIRAWSEEAGRTVGVLLDLPGPKLRVGAMAPGTTLAAGSRFVLSAEDCVGDASHACVTWDGLASDLSAGDRIVLDDGALELSVLSTRGGDVETGVVRGGPLGSHKGVNVPGVSLNLDGVTARDLELFAWGADAGVDLVAQSFVRGARDVERLRAAMGERPIPIVAKIEKYEALAGLDAIVETADAVMVARGDLAVETSAESVPPAQRRIVEACRAAGRPVIVATQMLESMTHSQSPTRAEASDVATAVFEGADAVMLSEETAIGQFPVGAVETMDRVCRAAEDAGPSTLVTPGAVAAGSPVAAAACALARDTGARVIVTATQSGATARAVASLRPPQPLLAVTPHTPVAGALALVWGVQCAVIGHTRTIEETTDAAVSAVRRLHLASAGERAVLTAGTTQGVAGSTDLIRVITM
jgi:pyruvate kinase